MRGRVPLVSISKKEKRKEKLPRSALSIRKTQKEKKKKKKRSRATKSGQNGTRRSKTAERWTGEISISTRSFVRRGIRGGWQSRGDD